MSNEMIAKELIFKLTQIYPNVKSDNVFISYCPYRVCPVGAHIDHQKGNVTGFAIDKGLTIAYVPSGDHYFKATSLNFFGTKRGDILDISPKNNDWADYLRGAAKILHERYGIDEGINCVIYGSLPVGGISSSAAVVIAFINALCAVNNIRLTKEEIITISQEVENKYVLVSSGRLDQSCELLSKKDHLLFLDVSTGEYQLIPKNKDMDPFAIAIIFSGVRRTLVGSSYNNRVDELKSASYCLKAFANMPYQSFNESVLRDVPYHVYQEYKDMLPENFRKRAEHFYTEMQRVEEAVAAWKNGDIEKLGKISTASGNSSIYNFESGSNELKEIHEIMQRTDGIYGGRFSGAGFKGCCVALIDPAYKKSIKKEVTRQYLKKFPQYRDTFEIFYCHTANGCNTERKLTKKR